MNSVRADGLPATPSVLTAPDHAVVVGPGSTALALASKDAKPTTAASRLRDVERSGTHEAAALRRIDRRRLGATFTAARWLC